MAVEANQKHKYKKDEIQQKRRSFLKKAVYVAPSLIVLGQLIKPKSINAADFGSPPSDAGAAGGF